MKCVLLTKSLGLVALAAAAANCGTSSSLDGHGSGIGVVVGGGGIEDLDAAWAGSSAVSSTGGDASSSAASSDASLHDASTGDGGIDARAEGGNGNAGASSNAASSAGSSNAASSSSGSTSASSASSSGAIDGSSASGSGSSSSARDAGTGGVTLTIGGPVHLRSLDWTIDGPNTYSGHVEIGDAQSIEWVAGGVLAADGYTVTVHALDTNGDPCEGTSAPFNVQAGMSSSTGLTITCDAPASAEPADVTTGSVIVEADVIVRDP